MTGMAQPRVSTAMHAEAQDRYTACILPRLMAVQPCAVGPEYPAGPMRYDQGTPSASNMGSGPSAAASQGLGIVRKASACITGDLMRCEFPEDLLIFKYKVVVQSCGLAYERLQETFHARQMHDTQHTP